MRCIQCQDRDVKWREAGSNYMYCSKTCQLKRYGLIGLKDPENNIDDDDTIGLESKDGQKIRITKEQAKKSGTISNSLAIAGPDNYFPLPQVDGKTLQKIEQFFNEERIDFTPQDGNIIENLLRAAIYIDYEDLLYYMMPIWVNQKSFPNLSKLPNEIILQALCFYKKNIITLFQIRRELRQLADHIYNYITSVESGSGWGITYAVKFGYARVVQELLKQPDIPFLSYNSLLTVAAMKGHVEIVNLLLNDPRVDPAAGDNIAIQKAASSGHVQVVDLLLNDPRVDPAAEDDYAIQRAAAKGHVEVVKLLLTDPRAINRVNPAAEYNEAITSAAREGRAQVVELLMNDPLNRVDPAANNNQALQYAVYWGHPEVVQVLLNDPLKRVDPSSDENKAIKTAASLGHTQIVELLLKSRKTDPEAIRNVPNEEIQRLYEQYRQR